MLLAPALLFGLLAIGLPLWLHRVTRAHPAQHPFASLMFLEPSETQRTAKHTIRYWLLLLLRIALIAALAFAFAGPFAPERIASRTDPDARLHAIVVDASYSMQHGERWRRGLDEAESIVRGARSADRVMLVRAAGQRIEVVHDATPASNPGSLLAALRVMQPTLERLDFGLVMSTAESWLGSPRPSTTLHFVSDLQATGAPLHFADLEPPAGAQLVMHSVTDARAANASISDAHFSDDDATTLQASVRHQSPDEQQRDVVLIIDGKESARQRVGLAASPSSIPSPVSTGEGEGGGMGLRPPPVLSPRAGEGTLTSVVATFPDVALTPGVHRLELRLEPHDALSHDDAHFAVIEHADPKALLISPDENSDDTAYFDAALGSLTSPQLSVEQRTTHQLPEASVLSSCSLVVIPDASALSNSAAARVLEYVAGGGAVLATLGARRDGGESSLLPGWRIGEMRAQPARVGEISTSHPVLRDATQWRRVRFFRARAVDVGADDKVLLAFEDGAPLLVERSIGAGRLLVLTAPIERNWNDLAIHPLFVQFIADAGRYLTGGDAAPASHIAGGVVMTGLTAQAGGQIFDPRGKRVLSLSANSVERLIPQATGFYEVRGSAARWLAVNVDPRESDLAPLAGDFVQRWQALRMRTPAPANVDAPQKAEPRTPGWPLLWLAAGLLIVELLLANRHLAIRRA